MAAALPFLLSVSACRNQERVVARALEKMALREKVGQLFVVRLECLEPSIVWNETTELPQYEVRSVSKSMAATAKEYPVGGVLLYGHNIDNPAQLKALTASLHALRGKPLVAVDEEGGRVARVAGNPNFGLDNVESMAALKGDPEAARHTGAYIGHYLKEYGFDIDFAPVADVNTNPENIIIGPRAFSDDPAVAAPMVAAYLQGLSQEGITGCLKHFPGHGDTFSDTHFGYAASHKNWAQIRSCEMEPFRAGIDAGARMIMTAHIALPEVTQTDVPATLSPMILQGKLRGELGYQGIIITDAIEMGAIRNQYSTEEACVGTLLAGADMILCPRDLRRAVDAVVAAVEDGTIPLSRIDESVRKVLNLKYLQGRL